MLFEHPIYSIAIAIFFGMINGGPTEREYSWVIILSAYAPDIGVIAHGLLRKAGITLLIYGSPISHGDFHALTMLMIMQWGLISAASSWSQVYGFICLFGYGFGAHFVLDALVQSDRYRFL